MRTTLAILAFAVFCFSNATAQKTGAAVASGNCNIAISGSNNTVSSASLRNCGGIDKEEADKIVKLLNTLFTKKDSTQIKTKLDELIDVANRPVEIQNCQGSNCVLGNNYAPQTYNQFGPPLAILTSTEEVVTPLSEGSEKVLKVHIKTDRSIPGAVVGIVFSDPITQSKEYWSDDKTVQLNGASLQQLDLKWPLTNTITHQIVPNSMAVLVNAPSAFAPGQDLILIVKSTADVHVSEVFEIRH